MSSEHVCLFDIDGTLLNTGGAGQAAMEVAIATLVENKAPVDGLTTAGRTDKAITQDLFAFHGVEPDEDMYDRFTAEYFRHLETELSEREGLVFPGIHELIDQLADRDDVLLGLLTGNYREGARIKLSYYDLDHHFAFGGFGDHHLHRDDVAREAMAELEKHHGRSFDPGRVWVIGDTPADVQCARAIGANVVAVSTGSYSIEELEVTKPDHLFADFSDPQLMLTLLS